MQNSKKLFELVSSLSKSEKIYFKKFSLLHRRSEKNNYIKLFELLQKQSVYKDLNLFKSKNSIAGTKNLPSVKHYLYRLILRCLRNYYHDKNATMSVKNFLVDIHILLRRGLYVQCRSLIHITKKIALRHNLHSDYLSVLKTEYDLLLITKASYSDMMENVGEQRNVLLVLKNSIDHMDPSINPFQHSSANTSATTEQVMLPDLFDYPELKHDQYPIESN